MVIRERAVSILEVDVAGQYQNARELLDANFEFPCVCAGMDKSRNSLPSGGEYAGLFCRTRAVVLAMAAAVQQILDISKIRAEVG